MKSTAQWKLIKNKSILVWHPYLNELDVFQYSCIHLRDWIRLNAATKWHSCWHLESNWFVNIYLLIELELKTTLWSMWCNKLSATKGKLPKNTSFLCIKWKRKYANVISYNITFNILYVNNNRIKVIP